MTAEGRLKRGKENYEYVDYKGNVGRFLDNPETLEYIATLPKPKVKEAKDGKPKSG